MFQYVLKRILLFVPTFLAVSLLAFGLSKMAAGDPVLDYLVENPFGVLERPSDLPTAENEYRVAAEKLNLDLPPFYFSINSKAHPDTLHRIIIKERREVLERLIDQYGNWSNIEAYYHRVRDFHLKTLALPDSVKRKTIPLKEVNSLYIRYKSTAIESVMERMEASMKKNDPALEQLGADFAGLKKSWEMVKSEASPGLLKVPSFHWHGFENQYHKWMKGFLLGDFGISTYRQMPVVDKVGPALFWTAVLNIGAITLAFLLSIPLGVRAAVKRGERTDRAISLGTFMLYSLPAFWIGTMLLIFFTSGRYGMDVFPGPGLGNVPADAFWLKKIGLAAPHLILPIFCITYPALAFISRQMRGSMVTALSQDFVRTARAKGLSEKSVVWRHAFRNALFPIITLVASVFPAAIAGSLVIELIFNIPGMGPALFTAILQKDWPIVLTVLMLGSVLTMVGILVADLLYAAVDPRVRLNE